MPCADLNVLRYYYHSYVGFYNPPLTKVAFFFFFGKTIVFTFCLCQDSWQQVPEIQSVLAQVAKRHILAPVWEKFRKDQSTSDFPLVFMVVKWSSAASGLNPTGKRNNSGLTFIRPLWSCAHASTSPYGQGFGAFGNGRVVCVRSGWELEEVHGSVVNNPLKPNALSTGKGWFLPRRYWTEWMLRKQKK